MIFLKRKPGEALVLETRDGPIIVQVLPDNELAVETPAQVRVANSGRDSNRESWLPPRPKFRVA